MKREREILCASAKYNITVEEEKAFQRGARWADATMIKKACDWLKENAKNYIVNVGVGHFENEFIVGGKCWTDFRKAMED